jgi:transposase InsO family protein
LKREFSVTEPSKAWTSNITYIRVKEEFIYLTTIIGICDRKIIGWSLINGLSVEETSIAAWRMSIKNRSVEKDLIFH